jgi:hypothetical protein
MPHSLIDTNLRLLDGKLLSLCDTAYFDRRVIDYLDSLRSVIAALLKRDTVVPDLLRDFLTREIWRGVQFLAGSAMRLQPFESVYGLRAAARDWIKHDVLIITALTQEQNFYFSGIHPRFNEITRDLLGITIEEDVVQVALPDVYRHKPLFSVALYHEFGHFIDSRFQLSTNVELLLPDLVLPSLSAPPPGWTNDLFLSARRYHLREYFADLFAASYTGGAIKRFLDDFAANADVSPSHPKTYDRAAIIESLLNGTSHRVIEAFRQALTARRCPDLTAQYTRPNVDTAFAALRTAPLGSIREVHGVLESGWEYLHRAADRADEVWKHIDDGDAERIVNDLVAKSIRNWMIREQWANAPADA